MPDSILENGELVTDPKLSAARKAMMLLANFQNTHNVNSLYESVNQIAIYVGVDIVDLMLSLKDVHVEEGTVDDLLDIAAKNLFKTVTDSEDFDYKYYAAILLSVAHSVLEAQRVYLLNMAKTAELSEPEKEIPNDTV
jgi:hypothetical protein